MAAVEIPGAAGGVLEIGDDIDHLNALSRREDLLQLIHNHAAVVGGHFDKARLAGLERVDRTEVGRALQQDNVARVQEDAGGEVQTLLRTGGDQNVVGVGMDVVLGEHALGNLLAQTGKALGGGILQRLATVLLEHRLGSCHHLLHGEELRGRQAAGKRNNVGLRSQFQQLTDFRPMQKVHSACELYHESCPPYTFSMDPLLCTKPMII